MGRYLNSQTRKDAVVIAGVVDLFKDIHDRWNGMKKPPKEVLGYLGAATRFASRAMKELDNELDNYEIARIFRMAETTSFDLSYVQYDLSSKTPDTITYDVTEDERDNIVEALTEVNCKSCDGCKKDCTVRQQFFKWDVNPIHEATDAEHPCQYMPPEGGI